MPAAHSIFSTLSVDNLDRIEIVRGPASVLYGSDAMAGVVQLFTRRGGDGLRGDVALRGGGFGELRCATWPFVAAISAHTTRSARRSTAPMASSHSTAVSDRGVGSASVGTTLGALRRQPLGAVHRSRAALSRPTARARWWTATPCGVTIGSRRGSTPASASRRASRFAPRSPRTTCTASPTISPTDPPTRATSTPPPTARDGAAATSASSSRCRPTRS